MSVADILDRVLREELRPARPGGTVLLDAAVALGAGEAKRAARLLGGLRSRGDEEAVAAAMTFLAATLDYNWFPGGGGFLDGALPMGLATTRITATDPDAALAVTVIRELVAATPAWRSIVDSARRTGSGVSAIPIAEAEEVLAGLRASGSARGAAPAALLVADLYRRTGAAQADAALAAARAEYADDPIGLAVCALFQLDRRLPGHGPEALGEDLGGTLTPLPPADPELGPAYRALGRTFAAAGSTRGVAAVALREARVAADGGDSDTARAHLARANALATADGDTATVQLAAVHSALLDVQSGRSLDVAATAGPIVRWATTLGSTSWVRGLVLLCRCRAERWRVDDPVRAQPARRLADALASGIGAPRESALVRREQAAGYSAANLRRAAVRLLLGELAEARESSHGGVLVRGAAGWAALVDRAIAANADAVALADPEQLRATLGPLHWLAEHPPAAEDLPGLVRPLREMLANTVAESALLEPLYRATTARNAGDPDAAAVAFAEAEAVPFEAAPHHRAVVLATQRKLAEANIIAEVLWETGLLHPEHAVGLFLRIGRHDLAREARATLPADDGTTVEVPLYDAEIALGFDDPATAVALAETAVARFEARLARLSRDVLRITALDTPTAAGVYTTAVRAHAALALDPRSQAAPEVHRDRAFALSDRVRGMTLTDLIDIERATATPETAAAARGWQRAGAELVRTIEDVGISSTAAGTAASFRARIGAAETALDDAEATFAATAPALFRGRRTLPEPIDVARVRERLAPGALLVQYHAADGQIICFTLTRDHAAVHPPVPAPTGELTCDVRRYHKALANPLATESEQAELGERLAEKLLDPIADELDAHTRVVVVPWGGLAALPFHTLPWGKGALGSGDRVVSYLPSVGATLGHPLAACATGDPLVVGDPAYAAGCGPRLPGSAVEAAAVAARYGVEPLRGPAATADAVLERLAQAPLVHLATHCQLRESAPYSSSLVLAGHSRLTVPDLMGRGLRVRLAVLSACDSGRGRASAGGDVVGLSRALLGSGVQGLVVSLWPVDDQYACVMMDAFHALLASAPPAVALAKAAEALRGMSPGDADRAYQGLGGQAAGPDRLIRSVRDIDPEGPSPTRRPDPAHPSVWAPFVYVGAP